MLVVIDLISSCRLVVVLERRTLVHDLKTLELLRTLETPSNPKVLRQSRFAAHVCCLVVRTRRSYVEHACTQTCFFVKQGCCALSTCFDPCLLALPSSSTRGTMRVYNAAITGSSVECEVTAHNSPVAVMAWNQDASLLASASNKGTVLRVHKMPQVMTALRQPNSVVAAALRQMYWLSGALKLFHQSMLALEKAHSTKTQQDLAVQGLSVCCQARNRSMSGAHLNLSAQITSRHHQHMHHQICFCIHRLCTVSCHD